MTGLSSEGGISDIASLKALFEPRTVAVIGASGDQAKFGGRIFRYLSDPECRVTAYPVNASSQRIGQHNCYPTVTAIGKPIDVALLAIPGMAVMSALEDCASASVRAAIVMSSGFEEAGPDGHVRQKAIDALRMRCGMRILGPNCIGFASHPFRMAATFATMWEGGWGKDSGIAVASQSGALASYLFCMLEARAQGVRYWCSTGNESDVDVADCIAYYCDDDAVRTILICLESVRHGARLAQALMLARSRGKRVIALKVGTSVVGKQAATSHTGAIAGEDRVISAVFHKHGVYRAVSFEELVVVAVAASMARMPCGKRIGLLTASGGAGVMMADRAEALDLDVPALTPQAQAAIIQAAPLATTRNPVDVSTGVANDVQQVVKPLRAMVSEPHIDGVVAFMTSVFKSPARMKQLKQGLAGLEQRPGGKPVFLSLIGEAKDLNELEEMGFPCFIDPVRAVNTMHGLWRWNDELAAAAARRESHDTTPPVALPGDIDDLGLFDLLGGAGIRMVAARRARTPEEALAIADEIGYPVVMKVSTPDVVHKSDIGGVVTNIRNREELLSAMMRMRNAIERTATPPRLLGYLLQPMVGGEAEVIIGARRDPVFGPVVIFGLGGKLVEILNDVSVRLAPVDVDEARRMVNEIRGGALLRGVRGGRAVDLDFIVESIVRLSRLAASLQRYESMELNPVIVGPAGEGGCAVDARIVLAEPVPDRAYKPRAACDPQRDMGLEA